MSILDSFVILKWFVNEQESDLAIQLRSEFLTGTRDIIVPDLLLYEVANVLRYNPVFATSEEIKESVETLFDIGIQMITPTYPLLAKSIDIAKGLNVTCYDATYLALAEELQYEFITADEKLYRKTESKVKTRVFLLANLKR